MVTSSSALGVDNLNIQDDIGNDVTAPKGRDALAVLANYSPDVPIGDGEDAETDAIIEKKARHPLSARRPTRFAPLHETAVMGLALVGMVAGYFAWRLSEGTISISAATPLVEDELEKIIGSETEIGSLRLGWSKSARNFVVTADRITAKSPTGGSPLALGQVSLTLNASALLLGQTRISRAEVSGLNAVVVIDKTGASAFGFGSIDEVLSMPRKIPETRSLTSVLELVRKAVLTNESTGRIDAIALRNTQITIVDPDTNTRLTLENANANITTSANEVVAIQASGRAKEMGGFASVAIASEADLNQRPVLAARFENVRVSALPPSLLRGPLARFALDDVKITGTSLVKIGPNRATTDVTSSLSLASGKLQGHDIIEGNAIVSWRGGPFSLVVSNLSARGPLGQFDRFEGELKGQIDGPKSLNFTARQARFSPNATLVVQGNDVSGSASLTATNTLSGAQIRGASLIYTGNRETALAASGFRLSLTPRSAQGVGVYEIAMEANGLQGRLHNDRVDAQRLVLSVEANQRDGRVTVSKLSGGATGAQFDFAVRGGRQSIDASGLNVEATAFLSRANSSMNLPSAFTIQAQDMVFGRGGNALFAGRASGIDLRAQNLFQTGGRVEGRLASLTARGNTGRRIVAGGRDIRFDISPTTPSGGVINHFQAAQLDLGAGEGIGRATDLFLTGGFTAQALTGTTIVAKSVEIRHPDQLVRPFWADNLRVRGDLAARSAKLNAFSFTHRGVDLEGETQITLAPRGSPRVDLEANVDGAFSVEWLLSAWPRRFLPETRGNISRLIPSGTAEVSRLSLAIPPGLLKKQIMPKSGMTLDFILRDVTVSYLQGMSEITDVSGQGQLLGDSLSITLPQGRIGTIALSEGTVDIPQFMPSGGRVDIAAKVSGDVAAMAQEIDLPPLAILSKAGLSPDRLSGQGSARLNLAIPLKRALMAEEIGVKVDGEFEQAGLARTFAGLDAYNGTVRLGVDNQKVDVSGMAWMAGNLFDFDWFRDPAASFGSQTSLNATGLVTIESLQAIGIDARDYAQGPFQIEVEASSQGSQFGEAFLTADFNTTNITLPGNVWNKGEGVKATASAKLYPRDGGGWNVQDLRFDSNGARLRGALDITEDAKLVDARFSRVMIENSADLSVDVTPSAQALTVTLRGAFLNLSPYLNQKNVSEKAVDLLDRPLTLNADIARVTTAPGRELTDVHADIVRDGEGWRTFDAAGSAPAGRSQVSLMMQRDGRRTISGVLSDAGFFAQLLYPGAPVFGGTGTIEGELPVVGANSSGRLTFSGKNIQLARTGTSPVIFDQVDLPMSVAGGIVTLRDGQAGGDAYTVKASGYVDVGAGRLDIRGVATPGGLNRVLADIPLFGAILGGGADEGLLGVTFTARGLLSAPRVQANPISALAPGFLRKLFESEAPLSPQPLLVASPFIGLPVVTKWPYGPTEDMSEPVSAQGASVGPAQ